MKARSKTILALDACETVLSLMDTSCGDPVLLGVARCGECVGCCAHETLRFARQVLAESEANDGD